MTAALKVAREAARDIRAAATDILLARELLEAARPAPGSLIAKTLELLRPGPLELIAARLEALGQPSTAADIERQLEGLRVAVHAARGVIGSIT